MSQDDKKQGSEEDTVQLSGIELDVLRQSAQLRRKGLAPNEPSAPNEPIAPARDGALEESTRAIQREQLKHLIKSGQETAKSSGILKRRRRAPRALDNEGEQPLDASAPAEVLASDVDVTKAVPRDLVEELRGAVPKPPRRDLEDADTFDAFEQLEASVAPESAEAPSTEPLSEEPIREEPGALERRGVGLEASSIVDELMFGVETSDPLADPSLQTSEELRAFDSPMEDLFGGSTVIDEEDGVDDAGASDDASDEDEGVGGLLAGQEEVQNEPSSAEHVEEHGAVVVASPSTDPIADTRDERRSSKAGLIGALLLVVLIAVAVIGMQAAGVF